MPETRSEPLPVPAELVARRIYVIRGQRVMLSPDLAELYQVETRALIQAVKRNPNRFPDDFMFQLADEEYANLKSQTVISSWGGARRANPYAFTEHGIAMLSSVLKSERAVEMNIFIIRAFIKLREVLATNKVLAQRIDHLERTQKQHGTVLVDLVHDIQKLKNPPFTRAIGFVHPKARKR